MTVSSEKLVNIEVDVARTRGKIRSLQGVNCGPLPEGGGASLFEQYRKIGVDYVRTHDVWYAFDIDVIFPDMNASTSKETSYEFKATDNQIQAIRSVGAEVLYRLGYSWQPPNKRPRNEVPAGSDNVGFAAIAGKSDDDSIIRVLISNFDSNYVGFNLTLNNPHWQQKLEGEVYVLDEKNNLTLVDRFEKRQSEPLVISRRITNSSVYLISMIPRAVTSQTATMTSAMTTPTKVLAREMLIAAALTLTTIFVTMLYFKKRGRDHEKEHG
jgi:hypothetical protein